MYMAKINLTHFVPELKTRQKVSLREVVAVKADTCIKKDREL